MPVRWRLANLMFFSICKKKRTKHKCPRVLKAFKQHQIYDSPECPPAFLFQIRTCRQISPHYRTPAGYLHVALHNQRPLAGMMIGATRGSSSAARKKERMLERLEWRIQKHDEAVVQSFCNETGVKRHVLKAWMHNNKLTLDHWNPAIDRLCQSYAVVDLGFAFHPIVDDYKVENHLQDSGLHQQDK